MHDLSAEALRPLYAVLSALDSSYIATLPSALLVQLQEKVKVVLNSTAGQGYPGGLLCLAILSRLIPPNSSDQKDTDDGTFQVVMAAFGPRRAHKTLEFIAWKAVTACSQDPSLALDEALEGLQLSAVIAGAVKAPERDAWVTKNVTWMNKLHKKVFSPQIEPTIQAAALNFIFVLVGKKGISQELMAQFENHLLTTKDVSFSKEVISTYLECAETAAIGRLFDKILNIAWLPQPAYDGVVLSYEAVAKLAEVMVEQIAIVPNIAGAILPSHPSDVLLDSMKRCAGQNAPDVAFSGSQAEECMCNASIREKSALRGQVKILLLRAAVRNLQPLGESKYASILDKLLDGYRVSSPHGVCQHGKKSAKEVTAVSLFEAAGTPDTKTISHNWRDRLVDQLSRDTALRFNSIVRIMGDVCRDLESRCDEAERPLREERIKTQQVESEFATAVAAIDQLREEAKTASHTRNSLTEENVLLQKQLNAIQEKHSELSAKFRDLEQEAEHSRSETKRIASISAESSRERDLIYVATLRSKDEILQQRTEETLALKARASNLQEQLRAAESGLEEQVGELHGRDASIVMLNEALGKADIDARMKEEDLDSSRMAQQELETENRRIKEAMKQTVERDSSAVAELRAELEAAEISHQSLQKEHQELITSTHAELLKMMASHQAEKSSMQQQLDSIETRSKHDTEKNAQLIKDLEKGTKRLQRDLLRKAKEIKEAHEWRRQLMNMMASKDVVASPDRASHRSASPSPHKSSVDNGMTRKLTTTSFGSDVSTPTLIHTHKRSKQQTSPLDRGSRSSDRRAKSPIKRRASLPSSKSPFREPLKEKPSAHNRRATALDLRTLKTNQLLAPMDTSPGLLGAAEQSLDVTTEEESFGGDDVFMSTDQR